MCIEYILNESKEPVKLPIKNRTNAGLKVTDLLRISEDSFLCSWCVVALEEGWPVRRTSVFTQVVLLAGGLKEGLCPDLRADCSLDR